MMSLARYTSPWGDFSGDPSAYLSELIEISGGDEIYSSAPTWYHADALLCSICGALSSETEVDDGWR